MFSYLSDVSGGVRVDVVDEHAFGPRGLFLSHVELAFRGLAGLLRDDSLVSEQVFLTRTGRPGGSGGDLLLWTLLPANTHAR